jgi:hypothetical protein
VKLLSVIVIALLSALGTQTRAAPPGPLPLAPEWHVAPSFDTQTQRRQPRSQPQPQAQMHPAVVRIVAPGDNSMSFGSGTLVFVGQQHGLVITNWHVINEATGQISVHFPDGFYSPATVQKVDRDWDLAILAIRKPNVEAVPLADRAPRPGELLTIAGYGSGQYRAATGRCTQYVAPGTTFPFEMVEVAVSARQGDSGGPILNSRGELAGVLFGEGNGRTSGSYCGRVRWFLASVAPSAAGSPEQLVTAPLEPIASRPSRFDGSNEPDRVAANETEREPMAPSPSLPASVHAARTVTTVAPPEAPPAVVASTRAPTETPQPHVIGWTDLAGETLGQQVKTVLAAIGLLAIILQVLTWMSTESAKPS